MKGNVDLVKLSKESDLQTLVENRTAYTLEKCELNVFETYVEAYNVPLVFNDFVITSMLRGKKVMHVGDKNDFDYLPGESVIVPASQKMNIHFPEASDLNPTQCVALAIDNTQIQQTIRYLNEHFPKQATGEEWKLNYDQYHFYNNEEIAFLINKVIRVCSDNSLDKDVLADLTLKELLVRVMQNQHLQALQTTASNTNPLVYVLEYIKSNLNEKISIEHLSNRACMSKATFYRLFKRELGVSPNDYILAEKMKKAKELLSNPTAKIAAISYDLGFNDANYFIRAFKKIVGITPGAYQAKGEKKA